MTPSRPDCMRAGAQLPETTRNSRVVVEICAPGEADCSDGSSPAPVKVSAWAVVLQVVVLRWFMGGVNARQRRQLPPPR